MHLIQRKTKRHRGKILRLTRMQNSGKSSNLANRLSYELDTWFRIPASEDFIDAWCYLYVWKKEMPGFLLPTASIQWYTISGHHYLSCIFILLDFPRNPQVTCTNICFISFSSDWPYSEWILQQSYTDELLEKQKQRIAPTYSPLRNIRYVAINFREISMSLSVFKTATVIHPL